MEGDENIQPIVEHLEGVYPEAEVLSEKNMNRRLHCFYVRTAVAVQQILKITYECMMDHPLHELFQAIDSACIPAMRKNENMEVVLFNDFLIEVREVG